MSTVAITSGSKLTEQFRARLRTKLDELGINQTEAANIIGMNRGDFSALLNGHRNPTVTTIEQIAEGLGLEIEITIN